MVDRMELSQVMLFMFNASSLPLDPSIESFLKSSGAISLDLGIFANISSDTMPAILSELIERGKTTAKLIETLKAENARLQSLQQFQGDHKLKQSYEKLQKDFQQLRAQSADALTSLKVLEDENDELMAELEKARSQCKNVSVAK